MKVFVRLTEFKKKFENIEKDILLVMKSKDSILFLSFRKTNRLIESFNDKKFLDYFEKRFSLPVNLYHIDLFKDYNITDFFETKYYYKLISSKFFSFKPSFYTKNDDDGCNLFGCHIADGLDDNKRFLTNIFEKGKFSKQRVSLVDDDGQRNVFLLFPSKNSDLTTDDSILLLNTKRKHLIFKNFEDSTIENIDLGDHQNNDVTDWIHNKIISFIPKINIKCEEMDGLFKIDVSGETENTIYVKSDCGYLSKTKIKNGKGTLIFEPKFLEKGDICSIKFGYKLFSNVLSLEIEL